MRFEFATANRILFGPGVLREVPVLARTIGRRALVVTGRSADRVSRLLELLGSQDIEVIPFTVGGEPTTDLVIAGAGKAKESQADFVLGFGGGSVVDAGKAIAAMATNPGELLDYLEVIGRGKTLGNPSLPYLAIATTAGPGTEVTRNAVLTSPAHGVKVSLRSPHLLPKTAVVDPELTMELPDALTASTGLDALTQLIEPFVSGRANPLTDIICLDGMSRVARSLLRAYENGHDVAARADMSLASLYGGLALANAGLGAVHGFAGPIGGMFPAPHGAVCAALLPHVMEINLRALRQRSPGGQEVYRYDEVARVLTRSHRALAMDGVRWVQQLCESLKIPGLGAYGITREHLPVICEKAGVSSSMKGNPIALSLEEMQEILEQAL